MALELVRVYEAVGGPPEAAMGTDGFPAGPTTAGEYLVSHCGRHVSRRYPSWSGIPWGAPLKEDPKTGDLLVLLRGTWDSISRHTTVTREDIFDLHQILYGTRRIPSNWVFNDFGHVTCYIYRDLNKNGRLDRVTERIHGEFLHPTPLNEAQATLRESVTLFPSHGCIHLRPGDIDEIIKNGYMKKGTRVVVHEYESTYRFRRTSHGVKRPFELHFYPGIKKLVVVGPSRF